MKPASRWARWVGAWLAAAAAFGAPPLPAQDSCVTCHGALGDERLSAPVAAYAGDVHAGKGFGCADCHGGDPATPGFDAMDPAKGFVGRPARRSLPQFCGRCHSDATFMKRYNPSLRVDQVAEFLTSVHGRRLARGDRHVATCISCHPAHAIHAPADPQSGVHPLNVARTCGACHADSTVMAPYGIPTDQLAKYEGSVHWDALAERHDLSAPTCNDCHGNHGAAPPGVSSVANVCGQCHTVMEELFRQTLHAQVFPALGEPGCAACHGHHAVHRATDELLGLAPGAACVRCHDAESASGEQAVAMRHLIDTLRADLDTATTLLQRAERAGVEVSQGLFELEEARTALINARAGVHAFAPEALEPDITKGLAVTARARERGQRAFANLRFRRAGLAVSVTIILVLIIGLVFKIRQLERAA